MHGHSSSSHTLQVTGWLVQGLRSEPLPIFVHLTTIAGRGNETPHTPYKLRPCVVCAAHSDCFAQNSHDATADLSSSPDACPPRKMPPHVRACICILHQSATDVASVVSLWSGTMAVGTSVYGIIAMWGVPGGILLRHHGARLCVRSAVVHHLPSSLASSFTSKTLTPRKVGILAHTLPDQVYKPPLRRLAARTRIGNARTVRATCPSCGNIFGLWRMWFVLGPCSRRLWTLNSHPCRSEAHWPTQHPPQNQVGICPITTPTCSIQGRRCARNIPSTHHCHPVRGCGFIPKRVNRAALVRKSKTRGLHFVLNF